METEIKTVAESGERRARFVYEGARLHATCLKCPVVPDPWESRESDFREQFVDLVERMSKGEHSFGSPEEAHDSWVKKYLEMGWVYGPVYDRERRTHPDLVPFRDLDPKEKIKDQVFLNLVKIASKYIW